MLRSTNDLKKYVVGATDGEIGQVKDFFFDDEKWVVRYLVVETGDWLSSRKVLISPFAISRSTWAAMLLPASITRAQVKNSPDVDTKRPVSRRHEMQYAGYYGHPTYTENQARAEAVRNESDDPHLRSCKAVAGYHIHAADGDIGHVQGFLVEDDTWAIRYLIVDTSNWWLGRQVLIAPQWIKKVNWSQRTVSVDLTRQAVQDAPRYDPAVLLNRKQELQIYAHHRRPSYLADGLKRDNELSRI
ncbi:MAG: PRC-barrel domain-containing protein [Polaromonas sp.]|uniref:PRC-barrel domain-containing protein n=1 Tax=Polaromonas sp. TaxID=1869339 RepID=UPI002488D009|nr:PRC-barrel domain-containing protein [Polaromonas sp.]MDI1238136.1 PRC-barrel domain-containing protein [Polaromonas sp.]